MDTFNRQALLLGEEGQQILSGLTGVIVGSGGISSIAAIELAHCGIGRLILVDSDVMEESNRPRIIGSRPSDVNNMVAKVEVVRRYINDSMPECDVQAYQRDIEDTSIREEIIGADFIVVGTDNATSRAYVNEICHRYYVPVLDLGVEFVAPDGQIHNDVGKINLMLPGTPCLWCTGHISGELLAAEALPRDEARKRAEEGYFRDVHIRQPSMMPFNGEIASRGVQLLILLFTGLVDVDVELFEQRSFLGINGRKPIQLVRKRYINDCPFCSPLGSVLGAGDGTPYIIASKL